MTAFSVSASLLVAAQLLVGTVRAQSACATLTPAQGIKPSIASGYEYAVIATGLTKPRGLQFDSSGNLLVIEANSRLSSHKIQDNGGTCVRLTGSKTLFQDSGLTHGIALSNDGRTLYVSTVDKVYSRDYNPADSSVGSTSTTLVNGMNGADHVTRTLMIPQKVNGTLVVSRGSTANVDSQASNKNSGVSTVKSFNVLSGVPSGGYQHASSGTLLGWGLRNEVGIAEHPVTGGIWGVENSVDDLRRDNKDVHLNNPGEELNFLGYLNGTVAPEQGSNFGYPNCLAAWQPSDISSTMKVGTQFASTSSGDAACASMTPPRLTFEAHTAPLDIKFNNSGAEAWISYHGSWDRQPGSGYSLGKVLWNSATGQPTEPSDSKTASQTILSNQNIGQCPNACLRPVGIAFDSQGRLYMSSDSSGEIYIVRKTTATASTSGSHKGNPKYGNQ